MIGPFSFSFLAFFSILIGLIVDMVKVGKELKKVYGKINADFYAFLIMGGLFFLFILGYAYDGFDFTYNALQNYMPPYTAYGITTGGFYAGYFLAKHKWQSQELTNKEKGLITIFEVFAHYTIFTFLGAISLLFVTVFIAIIYKFFNMGFN